MYIDTHHTSTVPLNSSNIPRKLKDPQNPPVPLHPETFACDHRPVVETRVQVPRVTQWNPGDMEPMDFGSKETKIFWHPLKAKENMALIHFQKGMGPSFLFMKPPFKKPSGKHRIRTKWIKLRIRLANVWNFAQAAFASSESLDLSKSAQDSPRWNKGFGSGPICSLTHPRIYWTPMGIP